MTNYKVSVIRSNRKTIAIQLKNEEVLVRAPRLMSDLEIEGFVKKHEKWIHKNMEKVRERDQLGALNPPFTKEELTYFSKKAKQVIPPKVEAYAKKLGVQYGRISIRTQRTRWGSCSGRGNLNFNCLLMMAPEEVLDYVIVHELCHLIEMNHSKRFWGLVETMMPDFQNQKAWLKQYGNLLIDRIR